jgi:hypothetical protein
MARVTDARHARDYVVWIRFSDGAEGEIDLAKELDGPVFEPLRVLSPGSVRPGAAYDRLAEWR